MLYFEYFDKGCVFNFVEAYNIYCFVYSSIVAYLFVLRNGELNAIYNLQFTFIVIDLFFMCPLIFMGCLITIVLLLLLLLLALAAAAVKVTYCLGSQVKVALYT